MYNEITNFPWHHRKHKRQTTRTWRGIDHSHGFDLFHRNIYAKSATIKLEGTDKRCCDSESKFQYIFSVKVLSSARFLILGVSGDSSEHYGDKKVSHIQHR